MPKPVMFRLTCLLALLAAADVFRGTPGGQMEATIDVTAAFGTTPANLHLASLAYQTADSGILGSQAPAPVLNDGNVDPDEFLTIPLEALRDENANGIFDRLESGLGFIVTDSARSGEVFSITWNCFPGRAYRVQSSTTLSSDSWTDVPDSEVTTGTTDLSYTKSVPAGAPAAFYRVVLLP